jgi:transposase
VAANPGQRDGAEAFTAPTEVNHRRYEALRAYYVDGLSLREAGAKVGYSRSAMAKPARRHKDGELALFAPPGRPGPRRAPRKAPVRARVVELRRRGLSVYEISTALAAEGTPLNRTGVGEILAEEGFGRLLRGPEPVASTSPATAGRDTRLPPARVLDFAALPARFDTRFAGLLPAVPDLAALDLPALAATAGYPGTTVIPTTGWLLSLLALKLTGKRRASHVDDLLCDPAAALFAGLATLPKKTALTDYSYRLTHDHQRRLLAALDTTMVDKGLAAPEQAIFDLDFHAVMHWGGSRKGRSRRARPRRRWRRPGARRTETADRRHGRRRCMRLSPFPTAVRCGRG